MGFVRSLNYERILYLTFAEGFLEINRFGREGVLVKAGYANLLTHPPNVKYEGKFSKACREARNNRRGLWK